MFLSLRQMRFARARTAVMGTVVALVAMLVVIVTGFTQGLTADTISAIRALPAGHLVFSADATSAQFSRSLVDDRMIDGWRARLGADVTPFGTTIGRGRTQAGTDVEFALFGTEPASFIAPSVTEGRRLDDRPAGERDDDHGVVISQQVADAGVRLGDVITVDRIGVELTVVGVTGRSSLGHVAVVYSSLQTWQQVRFGLPGGTGTPPSASQPATGLAVRGDPSAQTIDDLDAALGTATTTRTGAFAGAPGYQGETTVMNTIRIFLHLISALIVGAFFVVLVQQRHEEIALLKAFGASPGYVLRSLMTEIACLLLPAVTVGCAVASVIGVLLQRAVPFEQRPPSILAAALLLVGTGLAAVLVTARRAAATDPLPALGGTR